MIKSAHKNSHGFTLIELMIATVVFSVILLGAATSLIQIGRMYYKGVITSRTQNVARTVVDDIARRIQFSDASVVVAGPEPKGNPGSEVDVRAVCVGSTRYTYAVNAQRNDETNTYISANHRIPHVLWRDQGSCDGDLPDLTQNNPGVGEELIDQHMRLTKFAVTPVGGDNLHRVEVGIIYGDDDLLLPDANNPQSCVGSVIGGQWCAVSNLTTNVFKRVQ